MTTNSWPRGHPADGSDDEKGLKADGALSQQAAALLDACEKNRTATAAWPRAARATPRPQRPRRRGALTRSPSRRLKGGASSPTFGKWDVASTFGDGGVAPRAARRAACASRRATAPRLAAPADVALGAAQASREALATRFSPWMSSSSLEAARRSPRARWRLRTPPTLSCDRAAVPSPRASQGALAPTDAAVHRGPRRRQRRGCEDAGRRARAAAVLGGIVALEIFGGNEQPYAGAGRRRGALRRRRRACRKREAAEEVKQAPQAAGGGTARGPRAAPGASTFSRPSRRYAWRRRPPSPMTSAAVAALMPRGIAPAVGPRRRRRPRRRPIGPSTVSAMMMCRSTSRDAGPRMVRRAYRKRPRRASRTRPTARRSLASPRRVAVLWRRKEASTVDADDRGRIMQAGGGGGRGMVMRTAAQRRLCRWRRRRATPGDRTEMNLRKQRGNSRSTSLQALRKTPRDILFQLAPARVTLKPAARCSVPRRSRASSSDDGRGRGLEAARPRRWRPPGSARVPERLGRMMVSSRRRAERRASRARRRKAARRDESRGRRPRLDSGGGSGGPAAAPGGLRVAARDLVLLHLVLRHEGSQLPRCGNSDDASSPSCECGAAPPQRTGAHHGLVAMRRRRGRSGLPRSCIF